MIANQLQASRPSTLQHVSGLQPLISAWHLLSIVPASVFLAKSAQWYATSGVYGRVPSLIRNFISW